MRLLVYSHNFQREGAPIILFRLLRALRGVTISIWWP
jgi:hypothetical protein